LVKMAMNNDIHTLCNLLIPSLGQKIQLLPENGRINTK
jgi:hypothetical protein